MSYIDDWGSTPADMRGALEQICENPTCPHMRYLHGGVRTVRNGAYKWIEHEAGKCTGCSCAEFMGEPPISKDDVLDLAVALRYDIRLEDVGIAPIEELPCTYVETRYTGAGNMTARCVGKKNHTGDHAPDWSDLKAEG